MSLSPITPAAEIEITAAARARMSEAGVSQLGGDTSTEEDSAAIRARQIALGAELPGERLYQPNVPAFSRYPLSKYVCSVEFGLSVPEQFLGFSARSIVGQNFTTSWLYINQLYYHVPPYTHFAFNLPQAIQSLSLEWRSAPFVVAPVGSPNGTFAVIACYDEWVPPMLVQCAQP